MGFWVPKFFNSPILPPPFGAKRPGKENKKRFFRWDDFLRMSLPWCLMTCFEGPRGAKPLAGFSATIFLLIARFFSLVRSTFLSSSFFFDFDVEGFTIFVVFFLKIYVGFVGECCEFFFFWAILASRNQGGKLQLFFCVMSNMKREERNRNLFPRYTLKIWYLFKYTLVI